MGQEILKWRKKFMETFANAFGNSSFDSVPPNHRALSLHRACSTDKQTPSPASFWQQSSVNCFHTLSIASPSFYYIISLAQWSDFCCNIFKSKILISSRRKKENWKAWSSFQGKDKGNKRLALFGLLNFKGFARQFEKCMISSVCLLKVLL